MNLLIIITAKYLFLASIMFFLYALWILEPKARKSLLAFSFIAFPFSYLVAKFMSLFIHDSRPFTLEHIKPLIPHAADNGFPSDHVLLTMTIAAVIFTYNRRLGIVLAIISVCIGVARVLAKVHHVEDIVGSIAISIVVSYITYLLLPFAARYLKI